MFRHVALVTTLLCFFTGIAFAQAPAAPAPAGPPPTGAPLAPDVKQVNVSVKVVEFQTTRTLETGLSAYFKQRSQIHPWGRVTTDGNISNADLTFPLGGTTSASSITVFLDKMHLSEGDLELILQALEDQNRAMILAEPRSLVPVGQPTPTTIKTTQTIPYQNTVVVSSTASQITSFRETGVTMQVLIPEVIDDDANPKTTEDTYIKMLVSAAVNEEGESIVVGLGDQAQSSGIFGQAGIRAPTFVSRSVATSVWVRNGQVLMMGGLFRNTKGKSLATLPWLRQSEDMVMGLAGKVLPASMLGNPLSSTLGNRKSTEGRRELVFLIKAELWQNVFALSPELSKGNPQENGKKADAPGVIESITEIPQKIVEGIAGEKKSDDSVQSGIGGNK